MRKTLWLPIWIVAVGLSFSTSQKTEPNRGKSSRAGIVVMAHGGTPEWNAAVLEAVEPIREWCPVEVAFGMAERESLQQAVSLLESQGVREIAVVRLFVSGESFLEQTEYFLGLRVEPPAQFLVMDHGASGHGGGQGSMTGARSMRPRFVSSEQHPIAPIQKSARLVASHAGLSESPAMGRIVQERARSLSQEPSREAVLILAHGEGSEEINQRWLERLEALAGDVRALGFEAVRVATLREDWREKRKLAEAQIREFVRNHTEAGNRVIVVPFRVFGFGPYHQVLEGLDYVSDGLGLLPHPEVTNWIIEQASSAFDRAGFANPL